MKPALALSLCLLFASASVPARASPLTATCGIADRQVNCTVENLARNSPRAVHLHYLVRVEPTGRVIEGNYRFLPIDAMQPHEVIGVSFFVPHMSDTEYPVAITASAAEI